MLAVWAFHYSMTVTPRSSGGATTGVAASADFAALLAVVADLSVLSPVATVVSPSVTMPVELADYQREFLEFCIECDVLRFGDFTLKSGRSSPYFFNAGLFNTGRKLARLGKFYARAIAASKVPYDVLFGPAYKGIPLAASAAVAMAELDLGDVPYCYNRKEAKDHGEGGTIVGAPMKGRVLVVDDVITAGTAARESAAIIGAQGATVAGLVVALDRQESGKESAKSAIQQVQEDLGVPVVCIATLAQLIAFMKGRSPEQAERLLAHARQFGVGEFE